MTRNLIFVLILSISSLSCEKFLLGPAPENSPKDNFEVLWKTLDENYSLFSVRHINWDSLHVVYAAQITPATTEPELWDIASKLISNLNDGHVTLINGDRSTYYNSSELARSPANTFSLDLVKKKYLSGSTKVGAGFITYGKIGAQAGGKSIGYIYIASFASSGIANGTDWAFDIDKVVQELYSCDAIIIDVRNNGGGLRVTGDVIYSAFIDRDLLYFYQRLKTGPGHDEFGPPRTITISRRADVQRYTKKIALLTNRYSASGAEYMAEIFKNLPYSTQIGDSTFGAFGEITKTAQLPNGWIFWYPCTYIYTPDGKCLEGIGVAPDVYVKNTKNDIAAENDLVLDSAIVYLSK